MSKKSKAKTSQLSWVLTNHFCEENVQVKGCATSYEINKLWESLKVSNSL